MRPATAARHDDAGIARGELGRQRLRQRIGIDVGIVGARVAGELQRQRVVVAPGRPSVRSQPLATGFIPTALRPAARRACSSAQLASVLPTPVSVPVT
jgi:hypothetical protein